MAPPKVASRTFFLDLSTPEAREAAGFPKLVTAPQKLRLRPSRVPHHLGVTFYRRRRLLRPLPAALVEMLENFTPRQRRRWIKKRDWGL